MKQKYWNLQNGRLAFTIKSDLISIDREGYRRFLSLAGWLQVSIGPSKIWLPVEPVGERLGVRTMTVSTYRRFAVIDRFLKIVDNSNFKQHKATSFVFNVLRVPIFREAANRQVVQRPKRARNKSK